MNHGQYESWWDGEISLFLIMGFGVFSTEQDFIASVVYKNKSYNV